MTTNQDYPLRSVPFTQVKVRDPFWSPRLDTNRRVTLPACFRKCEETGRISNFAVAGGLEEGRFEGIYFNDSDVGKVIEGAAYCLALERDPKLEEYVDGVIAKIIAAMEPDGYLYTARTLRRPDKMPPGGDDRWVEESVSHETYNVGHIYEAAVAWYQATGKRNLLDAMLKNADLILRTFCAEGRQDPPGHQEIEMGLAKLFRVTGDKRYLEEARFLLEQRGKRGYRGKDGKGDLYGEYAQDHLPVLEQKEAVGHAVRATYMYCGMADVAALSGDAAYVCAIETIWRNVVEKKLYLTGGIGARRSGEAFGGDYELPNLSAYCETCAAIANAMWNHRMFLMNGEGAHIDIVEAIIYNAFLSGVALDGEHFFYPNPLGSWQGRERSEWFDCSCCPTNIVRFLPSMPGYAYASCGESLYINLFLGGKARVEMERGTVDVAVESQYPWKGGLRFVLSPEKPGEFAVRVRIPGWARNEPLPGGLYSYMDKEERNPSMRVNGVPCEVQLEKGYAVIRRAWQKGDAIELNLSMLPRRVLCDERVAANRGRVALMRGPVVYCVEGHDARGGHALSLVLPDAKTLREEFRGDLFGGVPVIYADCQDVSATATGRVIERKDFFAIPYYAWAHRGKAPMTVWLARTPEAAWAVPARTLAARASISTSDNRKPTEALWDQFAPSSSGDPEIPSLHWWPRRDAVEWVQYDFPQAETVSKTSVYWFDDGPHGGVRAPVSWRVLYREGEEWKAVKNLDPYGVEKDRAHCVSFEPVKTQAMRLEIQASKEHSVGLYEWSVGNGVAGQPGTCAKKGCNG